MRFAAIAIGQLFRFETGAITTAIVKISAFLYLLHNQASGANSGLGFYTLSVIHHSLPSRPCWVVSFVNRGTGLAPLVSHVDVSLA